MNKSATANDCLPWPRDGTWFYRLWTRYYGHNFVNPGEVCTLVLFHLTSDFAIWRSVASNKHTWLRHFCAYVHTMGNCVCILSKTSSLDIISWYVYVIFRQSLLFLKTNNILVLSIPTSYYSLPSHLNPTSWSWPQEWMPSGLYELHSRRPASSPLQATCSRKVGPIPGPK